MRIIITGGTGLIGSKLAANLAQDGHEVIVLSRNPGKHSLPAGVRAEKWDAKTVDGWGHLADGAGAIVNLAGESIAGSGFPPDRWSAQKKERIVQSRVDAGKAVLAAIEAASSKPDVLIQSSAVGYYGDRGAELMTEESAPGSGFLADVCLRWEQVTEPVVQMGVRRVVLRTGVVLSASEGALPLMVMPIKLFAGGPLGSGDQYVPWIHEEDEVRAIRFLIEQEGAAGVYNLAAPAPLTNREFGRTIAQVLQRPFIIPTPAFALRAALGETADIVLHGQRAVPQRLQDEGFTFKYPAAKEALVDLLQ